MVAPSISPPPPPPPSPPLLVRVRRNDDDDDEDECLFSGGLVAVGLVPARAAASSKRMHS